MGALTGKQRIGAAFKQTFADEKPQMDRIPAYLITGQCNTQLIGASIREWLLDPQVFVKAQVAAYERFRPDILLMMWDLLTDAEAIGNDISTKSALEDKGKLSSLQLPDPTKDGRLPGYLEAVAETKKIITDAIVSAVIAGPWTIAIGLRGATELIMDALKDPDYVHELMQF
jgi:uroporphyrinogen-III decarboxylase